MADIPKLTIEDVETAIVASRSPTYRWLWANYDVVRPIIESRHRGKWVVLAEKAGDAGIETSPNALDKAWRKVSRDKRGAR